MGERSAADEIIDTQETIAVDETITEQVQLQQDLGKMAVDEYHTHHDPTSGGSPDITKGSDQSKE